MAWEECPPHPFVRIFAQSQLHAAGPINISNLSTFDQTATDLLGRVQGTLCQAHSRRQSEPGRVHSKDHTLWMVLP